MILLKFLFTRAVISNNGLRNRELRNVEYDMFNWNTLKVFHLKCSLAKYNCLSSQALERNTFLGGGTRSNQNCSTKRNPRAFINISYSSLFFLAFLITQDFQRTLYALMICHSDLYTHRKCWTFDIHRYLIYH